MPVTCYVQMDALDRLIHDDDTTLFLIKEALKQEYKVYAYTPEDLSLNGQKLSAYGGALSYSKEAGWYQEKKEVLDFEKADILLVRQEPPFNMNYITNTYLLDFLPKKCIVINKPTALRNLPEKIIPHYFKEYLPPTLISSNLKDQEAFLQKYKEIVIKPLYLFGGKAVERLSAKKQLLEYLLKYNKESTPLILQKFLSSIEIDGDKRLVFINGKLEGYYQRRPAKGTFLTNFYKKPTVEKCELTKKETDISKAVACFLKEKKIYFAGVDIVENYILEINTTCTASLPTIKKLYGASLEKIFWKGVREYMPSSESV